MLMRCSPRIFSPLKWLSSRRTTPSSSDTRGAIVSYKPPGCSKISLIMWWRNSGSDVMSGLSLEWMILTASAADYGSDYTVTRIKNHEVGTGSRGELASLRGDSHNFGWIQSGCPQSFAQFEASEFHHVPNRLIHGQNTACQLSPGEAPSVLHFQFERSQAIVPIGHAGGGSSVRDQHRLIRTFELHKQLYNRGIHVNAVNDNIRGEI